MLQLCDLLPVENLRGFNNTTDSVFRNMVETTIDSHQGIVFHECIGPVTWEDMLEALAAETRGEAPKTCDATLWSLERGAFAFSLEELAEDIEAVRVHLNETSPPLKVAWVVNNVFSKMLIEGWYADRAWVAEWRVFSVRDEAMRWLEGA